MAGSRQLYSIIVRGFASFTLIIHLRDSSVEGDNIILTVDHYDAIMMWWGQEC